MCPEPVQPQGVSQVPDTPRPKLFILVGIPGCGKSTLAEQLDGEVVSSDKIREALGDINDQSQNELVFTIFHGTLHRLLGEGRNAIADSTALTRSARTKLREIAEHHGAETHLVFFKNPYEAIRRNAERERSVPLEAMKRMVERYERTLIDLVQERYTTITEIGSFK